MKTQNAVLLAELKKRKVNKRNIIDVLTYEPETGKFFWKKSIGKKTVVGAEAGSVDNSGYSKIKIYGRTYRAHRLAWLLINGEWPKKEIDHVNGIRNDNRIENLRLANSRQNKMNSCLRKDNTSGYRGVIFHPKKCLWQARIGRNGKMKSLGYFKDKLEATRKYNESAQLEFGNFYSIRSAPRLRHAGENPQ